MARCAIGDIGHNAEIGHPFEQGLDTGTHQIMVVG
jgi:hypothetical protein